MYLHIGSVCLPLCCGGYKSTYSALRGQRGQAHRPDSHESAGHHVVYLWHHISRHIVFCCFFCLPHPPFIHPLAARPLHGCLATHAPQPQHQQSGGSANGHPQNAEASSHTRSTARLSSIRNRPVEQHKTTTGPLMSKMKEALPSHTRSLSVTARMGACTHHEPLCVHTRNEEIKSTRGNAVRIISVYPGW